jgi:hypothetical protein
MASWEIHRHGDRLTIDLTGRPSESDAAALLRDLEPRLGDAVAEVVLNGRVMEAGIGPHLLGMIKRIGQTVRRHGKAFTVRPI